jgi:hypothetical protein
MSRALPHCNVNDFAKLAERQQQDEFSDEYV